jgi:hypothetical protein
MSKVKCYNQYFLLEVEHNGVTYDCMVSSDFKDLFECDPSPDCWVEIENIVREAAWSGEIEGID